MRLFELLTCVLFSIIVFVRLTKRRNNTTLWELSVLIPLSIHLFYEDARWQMAGLYLMALVLVIKYLYRRFLLKNQSKTSTKYNKVGAIISFIVILITILLLQLFPVKNMQKPTGEYKVGTMTYDVVDENREELYGNEQGQSRKIRLQLWYPTEDSYSGEVAPWIEDGTIVPRGLMEVYEMPFFLMDHTALVKSNSFIDAPLNKEIASMPVIIISHGWTGFRNLHSDLGELFASLGYLVIGVDHTYGSVGLVFEDGERIMADPEALPSREENEDFDIYASNLVDTYAKDSGFVIDYLEKVNAGIVDENSLLMFKDKISLDQLGMIGHSTGGGGVVKLALNDDRIKAVVGLDPWVEPIGEELLKTGLKQETMFFRSTAWADGINDDYVKILAKNESNKLHIYEIEGSTHQDFSMIHQFGPVPKLIGVNGELNSLESNEILHDFISQFMNQNLLEVDTDIEDLVGDYDVVDEVFHMD